MSVQQPGRTSVLTVDEGAEAWRAYVCKRTEAMPKNSLFGTTLENADRAAAQKIDVEKHTEEDLKRRRDLKAQYEFKLPDQLNNKSAHKRLDKDKVKLDQLAAQISDRQKAVAEMEQRVKYYQSVPKPLLQAEQSKKKMLLAEPGLDFELTKKMNSVGFSKGNNYNRDKFQQKPLSHQYAVIGDPFAKGMDFAIDSTETKAQFRDYKHRYAERVRIPNERERLNPYEWPPKQQEAESTPPAIASSIPANIRAQYGSKFVDNLFADKDAVERVKRRLDAQKQFEKREYVHEALPRVEVKTPQNIADLSHALRMNSFGGHTFHQPSLQKETHTFEVFERRYKDPDQFRHQWDPYGRWKEKELVREYLVKEYDKFIDSQPKYERNWDPNAKREPRPKQAPLVPKKRIIKPKPKPNLPEAKKEAVFEDIHFHTPPVTPPLPPQSKKDIVPITNQKEDDNFWEFFDQPLPSLR